MTISPQTAVLSQLRFKHLRLIDILARTGNLHRAADELNVTQPAASKILQDLERILGILLFDRSARPMTVSEIGSHVVEYARRTLAEGERFSGGIANLKRGGYGALAIGAIMATAPDLLPRALAELKRRRPLMTIHILAATSDKLTDALQRGEVDVVLGRVPRDRDRVKFTFEPLGIEELWTVVAATHPIAKAKKIGPASLEHLTWVLQPSPSPMRHLIDAVFATAGRSLENIVETTSVSLMLHLVRHAQMIAVLPSSIVAREVARRDFVRLPVLMEGDLDPYGIVTRKDDLLTPNGSEFISIVRDLAGSRRESVKVLRSTARRPTGRPE